MIMRRTYGSVSGDGTVVRNLRRMMAVAVGAALLLTGAPIAEAAAPVPTAVTASMDRDELDAFMAGLQAHQRAMDGLDVVFTTNADQLRDFANGMAPLIGSADPEDQAELALLTSGVNITVDSLRRWAPATRKSYEKALNRFLNMFLSKWSKQSERNTMRSGVAGMRSVFRSFFDRDIATLLEAGTALGAQDMAGFWDALAVAEGSEAFTVEAFNKPYRSLVRMT